jgi:hypothetical protein
LAGTDHSFGLAPNGPSIDLSGEEVQALVDHAVQLPAPRLLASWAICGPSKLRGPSGQALGKIDSTLAARAALQNFTRLQPPNPFSGSNGKSLRKNLVALLTSATKSVDCGDLPLPEIFEIAGQLTSDFEIEILDPLLTTVFTKKRLKDFDASSLEPHSERLRSLLASCTRSKATWKTSRGVLLVLSAMTTSVEGDDRFWQGIPFGELQDLMSNPRVRARLVSEEFRPVLVESIRAEFGSLSLSSALQVVSSLPELPHDTFIREFSHRLLGSSREAKLFRHLVSVVAKDRIEEEVSRENERTKKAADDRVHVAEGELRDAQAKLADAAAQLLQLSDEIRALRSSQSNLKDYEKTQARMDSLTSIVDLVERLRSWVGAGGLGEEALARLVQIADSKLEELGIEIVGSVGTQMSHDGHLFDFNEAKQSDLFVVLAPAYRLRSDVAFVFRKGLAKQA